MKVQGVLLVVATLGCDSPGPREDGATHARRRAAMVSEQLAARGITHPRVLAVMGKVPRHRFVPPDLESRAYEDGPLPIGHGQTISQPYIVALMTQLVDPKPTDRALDVGTGSGYQAAVLAELAGKVRSIEVVCPLADSARARLKELGYKNITVRCGDGWGGWPEAAPFDVIVLAAAPREVPPALIDQLAPGGRLVLPVGDQEGQQLVLIVKDSSGRATRRAISPVQFVPMTGGAQREPPGAP